jgi:alpha-acetolactate decarboxylase
LLNFRLKSGILKLDKNTRFEMVLPESGSFQKTEYKTDRSAELKKVEG